jgi:integrase
MEIHAQTVAPTPGREPSNKGKLIGQKPPLRPKHVWSIRARLQMDGRTRDLAMFNLAIDSKLRGRDVVALRVEDVAPSGYAVSRSRRGAAEEKPVGPSGLNLRSRPRQAVDDYIRAAGKKPGEFLFSGRGCHSRCMTTRQYARLVSSWVATIGLDPHFFPHALPSAYQSSTSLPSNRQLACRAAAVGAYQDREHRPVSRHRGGRRSRHSRAGRRLNYRGKADWLCPLRPWSLEYQSRRFAPSLGAYGLQDAPPRSGQPNTTS